MASADRILGGPCRGILRRSSRTAKVPQPGARKLLANAGGNRASRMNFTPPEARHGRLTAAGAPFGIEGDALPVVHFLGPPPLTEPFAGPGWTGCADSPVRHGRH